MKISPALALVALLGCVVASSAVHAQDPPQPVAPAAPPPRRPVVVPLDIEVVVSRHQGDTVISRAPYRLAVNANSGMDAQLNMGAEVPVPTVVFSPVAPAPASDADAPQTRPQPQQPVTSFTYRAVGTSITCRANDAGDGRYEVQISVDDSWFYAGGDREPNLPVAPNQVVFRNFRSRNTLLLRDGQSRQYTVATERVTGEVVRVEVTLRVVP